MAYSTYMEDCAHLHACRRLQKMYKEMGVRKSRGCDESCTAYENKKEFVREALDGVCDLGLDDCFVLLDEAVDYARNGANGIREGYDEYDVYCDRDLGSFSLNDLIDDIE